MIHNKSGDVASANDAKVETVVVPADANRNNVPIGEPFVVTVKPDDLLRLRQENPDSRKLEALGTFKLSDGDKPVLRLQRFEGSLPKSESDIAAPAAAAPR